MIEDGKCDVAGCEEPWLFVEHRDKIPIKRRCHRHWFEDLKLAPRESLRIVRHVDPQT